jgi:hypothetical protein
MKEPELGFHLGLLTVMRLAVAQDDLGQWQLEPLQLED